MNGLFISNRGFLGDGKGGVQVCTQEFIEVIRAADISLTILASDGDRSWSARLLRLTESSQFVRPFGSGLPREVERLAATTRFDFVFLNQELLAPLAPLIRRSLAQECKIVVLSHGLESTDMLHAIRVRRQLPLSQRFLPSPATLLGRILMDEQKLRKDIDVVCAIAPFDAELEKWLGTKRVGWLPRTIRANPLDWRPTGQRIGFVGTLNHGPNLEGLVEILEILSKDETPTMQVRIVGSPPSIGQWLESKYPIVTFLGAIDDPALDNEASTWNAFIHPIFCLPRGCSTKLAGAIAWQIPIITTPHGRRGFIWSDGGVLEANDASRFVQLCRRMMDRSSAEAARADVVRIATSSPSIGDVAKLLRELLDI